MSLIYEKQGHIARLGLNRPKQLNALDPEILLELHKAWKDVNEDSSVRVAVLYSALPGIFCSGMDLKTAIPRLSREMRMMQMKDAFTREVEIGMPVFGSEDAREGVKAQKEKRKPDFPCKY